MSSHTEVLAMKDLKVRMDHKFNQSALKDDLKETSCEIQLDSGTREMYLNQHYNVD